MHEVEPRLVVEQGIFVDDPVIARQLEDLFDAETSGVVYRSWSRGGGTTEGCFPKSSLLVDVVRHVADNWAGTTPVEGVLEI